jgi:hypothetical protein
MDFVHKIDKTKEFGFIKYCNCYSYSYPSEKIKAECYDTVLEAIKSHKTKSKNDLYESRLVYMNRLYPEFIQKIIINNEFRKPVSIIDK